ncbi:hypothetical protein RCCS2_03734 [Roseobacter sp. CCS2]|nr:hypothetical protein RCCS2_03734 [Roseobacter sp. CCS2]
MATHHRHAETDSGFAVKIANDVLAAMGGSSLQSLGHEG